MTTQSAKYLMSYEEALEFYGKEIEGNTTVKTFSELLPDVEKPQKLKHIKYILENGRNIKYGKIKLQDGVKINCFVIVENKAYKKIYLNMIEESDLNWMYNNLVDSHFAFMNKNMFDTKIRKSKSTKDFYMDLDLTQLLNTLGMKDCIAVPYKVNYYTTNDFFEKHKDTKRVGQKGTLILVPNTQFRGGELEFPTIEKQFELTCGKNEIAFIYFDIEMEHQVKRLVSGSRISFVFNVMSIPLSKYSVQLEEVIEPNEFLKVFTDYYGDKFNILLPEGAVKSELQKRILDTFSYIKVTFDNEEEKPRFVQADIIQNNDLIVEFNEEEEISYCDIESETKDFYKVEHFFLDFSAKDIKTIEMRRYFGYTGNSAIEEEYILEYRTGYLLNPSKENLKKKM